MGYLTPRALEGLAHYQYHSSDYTWLDNAHQPFWNAVASILPMWLAPNLVTLLGLTGMIISFATTAFYSPNFTEELPSWLCWFNALAMFWYVTMDAVDGKQARRTGASSPLGQLFDHGCDCVTVGMIASNICAAARLGSGWLTLWQFYLGMVPFFASNWSEYHTGVLYTGTGNIGVTEGQYTIILCHVATALFGQGFWWLDLMPYLLLPLRPLGVSPGDLPLLPTKFPLVGATSCLMVWTFFAGIVPMLNKTWSGHRAPHLVAAPGNKVLFPKGTHAAFLQILWLQATFLLAAVWMMAPGAQWPTGMARLLLMTLAVIFQWNTCSLIMSHMSKEPLDAVLWPIPAMGAVVWLVHVEPFGGAPEWWLAAAFCAALHAFFLHYVVTCINEICAHLGISCLTIRKAGRKAR